MRGCLLDTRKGGTPSPIGRIARTRLQDLDTQLREYSRVRATHLVADPPRYLHSVLGPRPPGRHGSDRWDQIAATIEGYRLRWNITDPHQPLGAEPHDPLQHADHQQALAAIAHHQHDQHRDPVRGHSRGIGLAR